MTTNLSELASSWFPVCTSKDLKRKPLACVVLNKPIVLFRSQDKVVALPDRCPHRGVPLSAGKVVKGKIRCPYHGWLFNNQGECVQIPGLCSFRPHASRNLPRYDTLESHGLIFIRPESSENTTPYFWEKNSDPQFFSFLWQLEIEGDLINVLENFLDGTHTHYVHNFWIRTDGPRQQVKATIRRGKNQVEVEYAGEGKQSGIISKLFESDRDLSFGRFILPAIAELEYRSSKGTIFVVNAYFTPQSENKHKVYAIVYLRKGWTPSFLQRWIITPFFKQVLQQDIRIVKMQEENIKKFPKQKFLSTEIDLIRPHIQQLIEGKGSEMEKNVVLFL